MQHKVPKYKSSTPLHPVECRKYAYRDKKVNKIQIIGVRLTILGPERQICPPNLIIEEIRQRPEQQKWLMVMIDQDLFIF